MLISNPINLDEIFIELCNDGELDIINLLLSHRELNLNLIEGLEACIEHDNDGSRMDIITLLFPLCLAKHNDFKGCLLQAAERGNIEVLQLLLHNVAFSIEVLSEALAEACSCPFNAAPMFDLITTTPHLDYNEAITKCWSLELIQRLVNLGATNLESVLRTNIHRFKTDIVAYILGIANFSTGVLTQHLCFALNRFNLRDNLDPIIRLLIVHGADVYVPDFPYTADVPNLCLILVEHGFNPAYTSHYKLFIPYQELFQHHRRQLHAELSTHLLSDIVKLISAYL